MDPLDPVPDPATDSGLVVDPSLLGGRDPLGAALARFSADATLDEAIAVRSRARRLHAQVAADASLHGVLLDLADRREVVRVRSCTGRTHRGRITAVGADHLALTGSSGRVLLALHAVVAVRAQPGAARTIGDRCDRTDTELVEALAVIAEDRPRVQLVASGSATATGTLEHVGLDVVVVVTDGPDRGVDYVRLDSVLEVVIDP